MSRTTLPTAHRVAITLALFCALCLHLEAGTRPEGISPDAWSGIQEQIDAERHAVTASERPGSLWLADNPGNRFAAHFGPEEIVLMPRSGREPAWHLGLELRAWGAAGDLQPVPPAGAISDGNRVEYRRGPLTEWYVNRSDGLEQGFTIDVPPADGIETLVLEMTVGGDFTAEINETGNTVTFRRAGSSSSILYSGLVAWDADERPLEAWMAFDADHQALRLVVSVTGAAWPVTVDPTFTQVAKLIPSPEWTAEYSEFGRCVAVDGDTLIVGSIDDDNGSNAGAVWVFGRDQGGPGNWGQVVKLTASDGAPGDEFGSSVAIDGDIAVVGAPADDGVGSASVFYRNQGGADAWGQVAKLVASDGAASDQFGISVSISGTTAVVGAYYHNLSYGAAYVFERDQGGADAWGQAAKLTASDGDYSDFFGWSVAIDGDTTIVGAYRDNDSGNDSGSAYVFQRDAGGAGAWGQVAKITAADAAAADEFGWSVAISGDTALVGARKDDDRGTNSGSAYVFERDQGGVGAWGQVTKIAPSSTGTSDYFGWSVAISGDTAIVSANGDSPQGSYSGSAFILGRNQGGPDAWGQVARIYPADGASTDYFGGSVSISGDTAVGGAHGNDDSVLNSGSAYVFERNHGGADAWGEFLKIACPLSFTTRGDQFGMGVSLDGDTAIVGAPSDNDLGHFSGSAYVFERDQGGLDAWGLVAKITPPDGATDDQFGFSVAISGDIAVVGSRYDDDMGSSSGSAYVFGRNQGGPDNWGQVRKLTAPDGVANDYFGQSVAIDGEIAVVGANYDDDRGLNSGSAYVFERNQGGPDNWGQVGKLTASDGAAYDYFGISVFVSGTTAIAGAYGDDDGGSYAGSAYVFERDQGGPGAWGQVAKLTASDPAEQDRFGLAVAVDDDTAIVGAYGDDPGGAAYVFDRDQGGPGAWGQTAKITASDGAINDNFGAKVAISGNVAFVGANGASLTGAAYAFHRHQGGVNAWGELVKLTPQDGVEDDYFGQSVAISGDWLLVGAEGADTFGSRSGAAYTFLIRHPPTVTLVNTTPDTGDGVLSEGEATTTPITQLHVTFSEAVLNPAGDTDPDDATNPANYLLFATGADATFETVDCAGGIAGSDIAVSVDAVSYDDPTLTSTLDLNGGSPLPDGQLRLLVCGTTSIVDFDDESLDGDDDGLGGDDFVLNFTVDLTPPSNPTLASTSHTTGSWSADDTVDLQWSGASDGFGSGVAGYSVLMDESAATEPDELVDVVHGVDPHTAAEGPLADGGDWHYHLRTCDALGNCSAAAHIGPFLIDTTGPDPVGSLTSPSHPEDQPVADPTIDLQWTAASDNGSGTAGYAWEVNTSFSWTCDEVQDTTGTSVTTGSLADGEWYAHVCAVDAVGNWGGVTSAGPFVVDTTSPIVTLVHTVADTGDGVLAESESTITPITQIVVGFNEAPFDPTGDTDPDDVTNPDNYLLVEAGPNATADTMTCIGGVGGDDVSFALDGVALEPGGETAFLFLAGGQHLLTGSYRLLVCGTTTIVDLAGNPLDGDGNGVGGDDFVLNFTVLEDNLPANPNFDFDLGSWTASNPAEVAWSDDDAGGMPTSGSARVINSTGPGHTITLSSAVTPFVPLSTRIFTGATVRMDSGLADAPSVHIVVVYFDAGGAPLGSASAPSVQGDTMNEWLRLEHSLPVPGATASFRLDVVFEAETASSFTANVDDVLFIEPDDFLFRNGFESGNTDGWSMTVGGP